MDHRRFLEEAVKRVATDECVPPEQVWEGIKDGTIVILANPLHKGVIPVGIGKGLRTKVNANIGTSVTNADINREIEKLHTALSAGADTVMDLSTGGTTNDIDQMRQRVLEHCTAPLGTVPIYQAAVMAIEQRGSI
ncbi:MAG TPA: phosphomethylpyrimidine synthase, partial [Clostridia bacterium]|nr:phosphomethylpyrimidine synthase [Clostridia bacterium]